MRVWWIPLPSTDLACFTVWQYNPKRIRPCETLVVLTCRFETRKERWHTKDRVGHVLLHAVQMSTYIAYASFVLIKLICIGSIFYVCIHPHQEINCVIITCLCYEMCAHFTYLNVCVWETHPHSSREWLPWGGGKVADLLCCDVDHMHEHYDLWL